VTRRRAPGIRATADHPDRSINPTRAPPRRDDANADKGRHVVECMLRPRKDFLGCATRHEERADIFLSAIVLAAP